MQQGGLHRDHTARLIDKSPHHATVHKYGLKFEITDVIRHSHFTESFPGQETMVTPSMGKQFVAMQPDLTVIQLDCVGYWPGRESTVPSVDRYRAKTEPHQLDRHKRCMAVIQFVTALCAVGYEVYNSSET